MAKLEITVDFSEMEKRTKVLSGIIKDRRKVGVVDIANEILRLSQFEVPLDVGSLQNSGVTQEDGDDMIVGYNKPYAARLHENPQYNFQNGRKGKYLEDPVKMNLKLFNELMGEEIEVAVR